MASPSQAWHRVTICTPRAKWLKLRYKSARITNPSPPRARGVGRLPPSRRGGDDGGDGTARALAPSSESQ
jgi:hypothetical protein